MKHVEHEHQVNLMTWAGWIRLPDAPDIEPGSFLSDYLHAVPNGGRRNPREGARLKAEGVKAGVSDLFLPIARQGKAGLWVELKAPGKKPTPDQRAWLARMTRAGYRAEWCDNWTKAAAILADYTGTTAPRQETTP